jgi:hypothetical protein
MLTGFRVTMEYARGIGLIERSSYTLSVQFLNRVSYVTGEWVPYQSSLFSLRHGLNRFYFVLTYFV